MDKVRTASEITGDVIRAYLVEGKRLDGRKPEEHRELTIEKNISKKAEGSVRVRLGKTELLVGVKMGTSEPYPDSPNKGNLMVTAELLPLSSPRFENGPPRFPAIELGRVTDRGLRESGFIDFEKLCIEPGKKVWTVFVDVYSINDDGNLLDAANLGAIAALKLVKIPKYDSENDKILYDELTDQGLPLNKHSPVSVTIHKVGDAFLVDPTREEEDMSETRVTFGIMDGIISSAQKGEVASIDIEKFKDVFEMAERVAKDLEVKLEKALK